MPKVPRRKQTQYARRRSRKSDADMPTQNGSPTVQMDVEDEAGAQDVDERSNDELDRFLKWAFDQGMVLNDNVSCTCKGVSANFGIMATGDIKEGECIFILPRPAALTPENCGIADFIKQNEDKLVTPSGWLPLILALIYEKTNPESKWKPYLNTFPNFDEMELPMFWPLSELDSELSCTGMVKSVATDIKNMRTEFDTVLLPLINQHPEIFTDPRAKDFQYIKEISAFIMAYSFTDDITDKQLAEDSDDESDDEGEVKRFPTIMVPMADLLNHVPVHNAELNLGESTFRMIATRDINKGEEVYNTYGRISNYTLLLMYGFSVSPVDNPYNTLEIPWSLIKQVCVDKEWPDMDTRCKLLEKMERTDDTTICLHGEGITDDALILQVLRMDKDELEAKLNNFSVTEDDGWESGDEEDIEITTDALRNSDDNLKAMLMGMADARLADYPADDNGADISPRTKKEQFAKHVRDSQILLLKQLKKWITWYK